MLLSNLNLLATAPDGVAKLRELILTLAVQGKLVPQDPNDEPASVLLKKIRAEKDRLILDGKIKRDKPLAEIAEEEKPFELPQGWEWVRLGTLTSISTGKLDANAAVADGQYPFFTCSNTPLSIDKYSFDCSAVLLAGNGDFNLKRYVGKFDAYQRTYVIEPILLDLQFLYFTLSKYIGELTKNQRGSAIPYLKLGDITDPLIPLPPLAEQSRIVTRVEELMRLCDALSDKARLEAAQHAQLVATLLGTLTAASGAGAPDASASTPVEPADPLHARWQRIAPHFDLLLDRPEAVDALEQTILQLAVRGHLVPQDPQDEPASALLKKIRAEKDKLIAEGKIKRDKPLSPIADDEKPFELPQGWEWVRFPELCEISGGATPSKANPKNWEGSIPWVSPKDMKVPRISDAQDHISDAALQGSLSLIPTGSLLMVVRGMILAHSFPVAETLVPVTINQDMKSMTPHVPALLPFLALLCKGMKPEILALVERSTHGTCKLESFKIFGMSFALPPLAEQSRIVARVASLRALCADLRQRLTTARTQQALLAQALVAEVA